MRRIITVALVLGIVGYFTWNHFHKQALKNQENIQLEEAKAKDRNLLDEMALKSGAIKSWEDELVGDGQDNFAPVFTIALEKVWLRGRPILITSSILDIKSLDDSHYLLTLKSHGRQKFYDAEFRFRLSAKKTIVDEFLKATPQILQNTYEDNVAVVGLIESIHQGKVVRTGVYEEEVYREEDDLKIGEGKLLELKYVEHLD